jgi:hypothetical protein
MLGLFTEEISEMLTSLERSDVLTQVTRQVTNVIKRDSSFAMNWA